MSWTNDKIKQLKKLWAKGKSTVEIAKELGISKNSVIGKVHRLELSARPSPIKRKEPVVPKTVAPKKVPEKCRLMDLRTNTCRWPIGEPTDENFHFCGKQTVTGKPYCAEHCKIAYTSLKELADQNAKNKAAAQSKKG
ncbi:MAG: global cell cycle regulator GcrA-like protein [Alphaproteobacteria bacterium]|nr:global cell cycle regulator GcrA-like protein [Alphaproteobacteria bacterium]